MNVNTENERKTSEDIYTSQNEFQFINRRARSYTEFVEHIVRNAKTTLKLKIAFFYHFMCNFNMYNSGRRCGYYLRSVP